MDSAERKEKRCCVEQIKEERCREHEDISHFSNYYFVTDMENQPSLELPTSSRYIRT